MAYGKIENEKNRAFGDARREQGYYRLPAAKGARFRLKKCDAPESMYYTDTDSSVSQLERLLQTAENARETISFYSPEKKEAY